MLNSFNNDEEAFFDVVKTSESADTIREKQESQKAGGDMPPDSSRIHNGQPITDEGSPIPEKHVETPIPAVLFPKSSEWKEIHLDSVSTASSDDAISIEKRMHEVVKSSEQNKTETIKKEQLPRWSFPPKKGAEKMHALKKENDDHSRGAAMTPSVNILQSEIANDSKNTVENAKSSPIIAINKSDPPPYSRKLNKYAKEDHPDVDNKNNTISSSLKTGDKRPVKSRIVPTVDTAIFQASVIEADTDANECIIMLTGKIDHEQHQDLERFFHKVIQKHISRLFCDIGGLLSISSSGWGLLVAEMQRLRKRGGDLFLCGLQGEVERSFKILDLDKLFLTTRTVSEALRIATPESDNLRPFPKSKDGETLLFKEAEYLSIEEKIHHIIGENPDANVGEIHKRLKSEALGKIKISRWKLLSKLRSMNLGSKEERYRFFRSS